jgi:hypothetical protein
VSVNTKDLKNAGVVVPTMSTLNCPVCPQAKYTDFFLRLTVDYCELNQKETPIAVAIPAGVSLLEQVNTSFGTWYAIAFFSIPVCKAQQKQFALSWQGQQYISLSYLSSPVSQLYLQGSDDLSLVH